MDKVAHMIANMVADMVADIEVDKVDGSKQWQRSI